MIVLYNIDYTILSTGKGNNMAVKFGDISINPYEVEKLILDSRTGIFECRVRLT